MQRAHHGNRRDHPRLRGEKFDLPQYDIGGDGSPPLTRGKAWQFVYDSAKTGITPAYAGKSPLKNTHRLRLWDHPRLRGEKSSRARLWAAVRGSPPLTRGKETATAPLRAWARITPAYAGKRLKKSHKIGLRQFAKRPIPLTSQIRQRSKSNPPRPGAHRKHPSQNVQQASSAYNL